MFACLVDVGDVKAVVTERQKCRGLRSAAPGLSEPRAAAKVWVGLTKD